jgi:predicted AAA+ superfamily ATPase
MTLSYSPLNAFKKIIDEWKFKRLTKKVSKDDVQKRILFYLADHPGSSFTAKEISKALDLPEDLVLAALVGSEH